ncbi:Ig-like domain-containing protein [Pseudobacillus sp. 179-B 2D1 NHS]|uniref:CAP domain-containing protein n=1 Tax=Pseudobacillus sp. 179-B 2D1 NHS TaxID=3374292 RepID=UPI00387A01EE
MNKHTNWKMPFAKAVIAAGLIVTPVYDLVPNLEYTVSAANVAETGIDENMKQGWELLNQWRQSLGLSVFQLNSSLLESAKSHAEYMAYHNSADGHSEREGYEKFTGIGPEERAEHFGYTGQATEVLVTKGGQAVSGVEGLIDAPYHRIAMMDPALKEGGIYQEFVNSGWNPLVINMGKDWFGNEVSKTIMYPYNGQLGVKTGWQNTEIPDPLRYETNSSKFVGYPISVSEFGGRSLKAEKASITDSKGKQIEFYCLDATKESVLNTIFLIPKEPLSLNETYHVQIDASYKSPKGEPMKKSYNWSFKTARTHAIKGADTRVANGGIKLAQLHLTSGGQQQLSYEVYKGSKLIQSFNTQGDQQYKGSGLTDGTDYRLVAKLGKQTWSSPMKVSGYNLSFSSSIPTSSELDNMVSVEGTEKSIDLSSYFIDQDSDTLKYQVTSSDESIAEVSVIGNTLKVMAKKSGTTNILVHATDTREASVSTSFAVQVTEDDNGSEENPTNQPPKANSIPNLKGNNSDTKTINLLNYFTDGDGDKLNFSATSSNENVATVSVNNGTLSIKPKKIGQTTIKVTAEDNKGGKASESFTYTVENRVPSSKVIEDHTMNLSDQLYILDLNKYFSDADGDKLTYTASSSDNTKAIVSIKENQLIVQPKSLGKAVITIKADDGQGGVVERTFNISIKNDAPSTNPGEGPSKDIPPLEKFKKEFKTFKDIQSNKSFLVTIKGNLDRSTVTEKTVFALDNFGNLVDIKVEALSSTQIRIIPKSGGWTTGQTFTIYLDDEIKGLNGKKLKEPVKFTFTVQ